MYKVNSIFHKYEIKNSSRHSNRMLGLCQDNVMLKSGLSGYNFYALKKNILTIKNENVKKYIHDFFGSLKEPLYEVLHTNTKTKIYLDCEFSGVEKDKMDKRWDLYIKLDKLLKEYLYNNKLNNDDILYMDASREYGINTYKISLHIIVNNCGVFVDRVILKNFIKNFTNTLSDDFIYKNINFIDNKVYNVPQLFKTVYSPCKDNDTLLKPFYIKNNSIIILDMKYLSNNLEKCLIGDYFNSEKVLDELFPHNKKIENQHVDKNKKENNGKNNINIPDWKIQWIMNNRFIKNIYNIRNIINNKINLNRIKSDMCYICNRNHDNENAFCIIDENNIVFYCGRNNNGKVIGSWYKKNNIKNNEAINVKAENDEINNLNKKINKLNNEIIMLKKNYNTMIENNNELRVELNNLLKEKNIKPNRIEKNISTDMWKKYYTLGNLFVNGGWEKIIGSWKEKNISKLKNRSYRIVKYLDFIKEKKIENKISLRKIFHFKNHEFDQFLSSL